MELAATRLEVAMIFGAMFEREDVRELKRFIDLEPNRPFTNAIERAYRRAIVEGYPDNTFRPRNTITRAETSAIIARTLDLTEISDREFPDISSDHWARGYIAKVVAKRCWK